jgi:hypothetical protein
MKKYVLFFILICGSIYSQIDFNKFFIDKTLRLDFFHTGNNLAENITFDKLIEEGQWSGSKKNLIDKYHYGYYVLQVYDSASNQLIYSRGFSTLYQEWQTTEESKNVSRTFSGSVSMPFPQKSIRVEIYRKDRRNNPEKKFEYVVNPGDYFIIKEKIKPCSNFKVHFSGEPSQKLDIVLIPEGYTKEEMDKFKKDCDKFAGYLFDYSPFKESKNKINIWGIEAPSVESGTDIPGKGEWKQTILNSRFYTFDSERYLMTTDYSTVKDIAANAPYDQIYIIVNTQKYGGGSIYNFYSVTAADNKVSNQIFIHEFGHGFAGLADEYADDSTYLDYYPLDVEPWEANITTLVDFDSKWKSILKKDIPVPTPKEDKYKDEIGVFEGGGYVNKGVYRPTINSIMNSFLSNEFNDVCKKAIQELIDFYSE